MTSCFLKKKVTVKRNVASQVDSSAVIIGGGVGPAARAFSITFETRFGSFWKILMISMRTTPCFQHEQEEEHEK